jgi:mannosyltransferase OCH1-like enzyme
MDSKTIPKVIHYCWFGGKRKPKLVRDCLKSWRKYLPDYEIIEWNETNSDLSHPFVKEAYRLKKWAFVADYIRLKILYKNGGIYLDTDMMLCKSLNDFLNYECFFGAEEKNIISCGVIGAIRQNYFIEKCLNTYGNINFDQQIIWDDFVITLKITDLFRIEYNYYEDFNNIMTRNKITVFPPNFFYPFPFKDKDDIVNYEKYITKDSYAVHLWVGSWKIYNEFNFLRNGEYRKGFKTICQKFTVENLSFKYFRKILSSIKESLTK